MLYICYKRRWILYCIISVVTGFFSWNNSLGYNYNRPWSWNTCMSVRSLTIWWYLYLCSTCLCANTDAQYLHPGMYACMCESINAFIQVYEFMFHYKYAICHDVWVYSLSWCILFRLSCLWLAHAFGYFVFPCNRCNKEHFELELELWDLPTKYNF